MNNVIAHYDFLAAVYAYPEDDYTPALRRAQAFLDGYLPEAADRLRPFTDFMAGLSASEQQELFIRSFEVQSVTTLDLGYVLFGDDYKRGELLVNLNREHREVGNECGVELADHLANVLRLLPRMQDWALVTELAEKIVWHALRRMISGFDPEQVALKDKFYEKKYKTILDRPRDNYTIYARALDALYRLLQHDFRLREIEQAERTSDFLRNLHTEIKLEDD